MLERLYEPCVGLGRMLQQLQKKRRIVIGQLEDTLMFDDAPRLAQSCLNDELIQRRAYQVGCLLKSVLHALRHPGRNSASIVGRKSHGLCRDQWTVDCGQRHSIANGSTPGAILSPLHHLALPRRTSYSFERPRGSSAGLLYY